MITIAGLVAGGIYQIRSRNLDLAVYDGGMGFVGIREKMGARYLFKEYAWEQGPPFGTVAPEPRVLIGQVLPDVPLSERLGTKCADCGGPAWWTGPPVPAPWACAGGCEKPDPRSVENEVLFRVLEQAEEPDPGREARLAKWR